MLLALLACSDTKLTPAGDDTASAGSSICPPYSGFNEEGQTWSWTLSTDRADMTTDLTLLTLSADSVTISEASTAAGDTFSGTWAIETVYRCDADGVWLVQEHVVTHQEVTWGVLVALVERDGEPIVPQGATVPRSGDVASVLVGDGQEAGVRGILAG